MPDEKTYRRRRAVFLLLVLGALFLLTGSFVGAFGGAERGVAGVITPVQEFASKVAKPGRDLVNWVGDTVRAKGEVEELREERDQLQIANGQLVGLLSRAGQENALEENMAAFTLDRYGMVEARVGYQSVSAWYRNVEIDRGSSDGIAVNDPVVAPGGLAGKVIRTQAGSAVVRLITDPESGVTAQAISARTRDRARGPLQPSQIGTPGDLILKMPKSADHRRGDRVYTAGIRSSRLESRFPPDIPIGEITQIENPDADDQVVHVRASADLRRLDLVRVLTEPGARAESQ